MRVATFNVYPNEFEAPKVLMLVAKVEASCIWEQGLHLTERHAFHARNEEGAARALLGNIAMDRTVADGHFFIPFFFFFSYSLITYLILSFLLTFLLNCTQKRNFTYLYISFLSKYFCTGIVPVRLFLNSNFETSPARKWRTKR